MVKRRKKQLKKVRAAKKKAGTVKRLKLKGRAARPAAKKVKVARQQKVTRPVPAKAQKAPAGKAAAKAVAQKPDDKQAKGAKTPIKSAKLALELLEAKVNEVKT